MRCIVTSLFLLVGIRQYRYGMIGKSHPSGLFFFPNHMCYRHYYGPQVVGSDGIDIDGMQNIIMASSWVRSGVMLKVHPFLCFLSPFKMWKFADFSITGSSLAAKRKILQNYSKPVNEVALEGSESTTQVTEDQSIHTRKHFY